MGMPNGQPVPWLYDQPGVAYHGVAAIYEEMRQAMAASHGGISWQHLQQHGSAVYPWPRGASQGQAVVFTHTFPTANGRAQLVPTQWRAPAEVPDTDYPLVLITGRQLEHWHTGSMTRRSHVLDAIEPEATASVNANTLQAHGLAPGDWMQLTTRRGSVQLRARLDPGTPDGAVFVPFAYAEAAANLLTHAALDPFGKIPEFKYCAVRLSAAQVEPSTTQA
jgi:formate dehydrogenase major subunit